VQKSGLSPFLPKKKLPNGSHEEIINPAFTAANYGKPGNITGPPFFAKKHPPLSGQLFSAKISR
jgi:hypothetical protein